MLPLFNLAPPVTDQIEWKFTRGSPLVPAMFLLLYVRRRVCIYLYFLIETHLYVQPNNKAELFITTFGLNTFLYELCVTSTVKERGEHFFFASCLVHNIINPWRWWWRYSRSRFKKKSCAPLRAQFSFPYPAVEKKRPHFLKKLRGEGIKYKETDTRQPRRCKIKVKELLLLLHRNLFSFFSPKFGI